MNKGLLWGGGLGGLTLALLAGGLWLGGALQRPADPVTKSMPSPMPMPRPMVSPSPSSAGDDPAAPATAAGSKTQGAAAGEASRPAPWAKPAAGAADAQVQAQARQAQREERRKVRQEIRKLAAQLQAKGPNATLEDLRRFLDDAQLLSQGEMDPQYFATMRKVVEHSARAQHLNAELAKIATSTQAQDVKRKQEVLAELRDISGRISSAASTLGQMQRVVAPAPAAAPATQR